MRSGKVQYQESLSPLMVPIDEVTQHPANYNNGDVELIVESIMVNGMYRPIWVSRETKEIVGGNHTWMACKELHAEVIPVIWLDGDEEQVVRKMVADNEIARKARPDEQQLLDFLNELDHTEYSLQGTGMTHRDLEILEALVEIPVDSPEYASWPTLCFQIPPHVRRGFMELTKDAGGDRERFELLLRLAGWDGHG